jgi:Glycosyltransferases involved in cell wall biogenesis
MKTEDNFAIIVPMANEEPAFFFFINELKAVLDRLEAGRVYCIVDDVSKDRTLALCKVLSESDKRFVTVYAPDGRTVVDAYLRGYREAFDNGHKIIIEMDAGMSHDPGAVPLFLRALNEGNECVFGSRFMKGGSMRDSGFRRFVLSRVGTFLANALLGTKLTDMTSGFEGFHRHIVKELLDHRFRSRAHFFQTEVRYFLRRKKFVEVPICYGTPSPRVSGGAVRNAVGVLLYYFLRRVALCRVP